jgi:nucleotide-binding universal stress UspA family protein
MYKKILVTHAGTSAGNKALVHAREMGKKHDSSVTILHVIEHIRIRPQLGSAAREKNGQENSRLPEGNWGLKWAKRSSDRQTS